MTDQGWVKAGELHEGSKVLNSRKEYEVVESIEYKGYNEIEVYNLIVENYHTFFITELGLMVHNIDCKNATLGQIFKQVGDNISDTKIKGDFEDVIKKLDDIAERNNIEEYIKNFDSRFRGLDPNNLDEIKKIISDTSKDIDNHSSSLFKGTEGAAEAVEKVNYGEHYIKGKNARKEVKPNIEYTTPNGHNYFTDELGRIKEVEGSLNKNTAKRKPYDQKVAGREDRLPTDDGGHLIASIFEGSGELDNLVPMDATLNRGDWKAMENSWAKALDNGKTVDVKIEPIYSGTSQRPISFEVEYKIGNGKWIQETFKN